MSTDIDIFDRLIRWASRPGRSAARKASVEAERRLLEEIRAQALIRELRGKVDWEGEGDGEEIGIPVTPDTLP
jgi:hypothetical protein